MTFQFCKKRNTKKPTSIRPSESRGACDGAAAPATSSSFTCFFLKTYRNDSYEYEKNCKEGDQKVPKNPFLRYQRITIKKFKTISTNYPEYLCGTINIKKFGFRKKNTLPNHLNACLLFAKNHPETLHCTFKLHHFKIRCLNSEKKQSFDTCSMSRKARSFIYLKMDTKKLTRPKETTPRKQTHTG